MFSIVQVVVVLTSLISNSNCQFDCLNAVCKSPSNLGKSCNVDGHPAHCQGELVDNVRCCIDDFNKNPLQTPNCNFFKQGDPCVLPYKGFGTGYCGCDLFNEACLCFPFGLIFNSPDCNGTSQGTPCVSFFNVPGFCGSELANHINPCVPYFFFPEAPKPKVKQVGEPVPL